MSAMLRWDGGEMAIADTSKARARRSCTFPRAGAVVPPVGATVRGTIDWGDGIG